MSLSGQELLKEYELAQGDPALQNKFLAFNMGLPMQDTAYYFTPQDTKLTEFNLSVFNKNRTYVGIDLSLNWRFNRCIVRL
jgi:Phage Terminase